MADKISVKQAAGLITLNLTLTAPRVVDGMGEVHTAGTYTFAFDAQLALTLDDALRRLAGGRLGRVIVELHDSAFPEVVTVPNEYDGSQPVAQFITDTKVLDLWPGDLLDRVIAALENAIATLPDMADVKTACVA